MELNICYLIGGSIPYFLEGLREKSAKVKSLCFKMQDAPLFLSSSFSGGLTDRLAVLRNSEKVLESWSYMSN